MPSMKKLAKSMPASLAAAGIEGGKGYLPPYEIRRAKAAVPMGPPPCHAAAGNGVFARALNQEAEGAWSFWKLFLMRFTIVSAAADI